VFYKVPRIWRCRTAAQPGRYARAVEQQLILESVLTCPTCGAATVETMPTDACVYFYECASCHSLLRPEAGDCCFFCSYGSVKCPPIQQSSYCCSA